MKEITLTKSEDGIKIFKYLKKVFPSMPDSLLHKLFRKKYFTLNNKKAVGNETLFAGDKLKIFLGDNTYNKYIISDKTTNKQKEVFLDKDRLVYEDDNIIIFNKPSGMLSQGDKSESISVNTLLNTYLEAKKSAIFKPSVVNRLDRNTEGLVIFAKTYIAAREISKMIKEMKLEKHYLALVNGVISKNSDTLINYFKKDEKSNKAIIYDHQSDANNLIEVKLIYKVIKRYKETTLLDVNLITGKSHQIRAQLSHIGHPIICDKKYMDSSLYKENVEKYKKVSQELTCYKFRFGEFKNNDMHYLSNKEFKIER